MRTNLPRCHWTYPAGLILVLLSTMLLVRSPAHAQAEPIWQINTLDHVRAEENDTALALDAAGYPVVSYFDTSSGGLKLLHCNDANCSGNDESIQIVDSDQDARKFTALVLDAAGYPVISYFGWGELKLAHCNDANCSGNDESIQVVDSGTYLGSYNALVLDAAGYPVISYFEYYWDFYNGGIKLAHCNDVNCSGHDESIQTVDGAAAFNTALALDTAGHPVISYPENSRSTQCAIQLAHCNDANCKEHTSITYLDPTRDSGFNTSLVLDAAGYPVISYNSDGVRLVHCNDVNCSGDDESSQLVANTGFGVMDIALALNATGYPVISYAVNSYSNPTTNGINLARCNDVNCNGNDESFQIVDSAGDGNIALVLDAAGYSVISYYGNDELKLARQVDLTPPGVTINQADSQVDPTTNPLIHFTVVFTEAVTGFASGDITLEGTAGATTVTVNEQAPHNGTTYDVIISGMTTSGTVVVAIPAAVATDLSGNGNTAALSSDNSVTFVLNHPAMIFLPLVIH